jgi:hypothetical protein
MLDAALDRRSCSATDRTSDNDRLASVITSKDEAPACTAQFAASGRKTGTNRAKKSDHEKGTIRINRRKRIVLKRKESVTVECVKSVQNEGIFTQPVKQSVL